MSPDTLETRFARMEANATGRDREIRDIKARLDKNEEVLLAVHRITMQNETILEKLVAQDDRIKTLEGKAGKRWEAAVGTAIAALVTGAAGFAVSQIVNIR